ncbi:hypothetical protein LTR36_001627 [Oleoguttula mirabilis]|uniref:TECPR1-like DysF domain-containing protein n=1 Tax=Oleoguttula mirabilis TaxID=1507867 RepID=A0AAV9JNM7_9PEZI|nr:hypothetical protein LTR36_001627 [Oleoguttula mirabilis]
MEAQDGIANRDEPLPVIELPSHNDEASAAVSGSEQRQSTRGRIKSQAQKIKDMLGEHGAPEARQSLQDRLFGGIMSQIIPPEARSDNEENGEGDGGNDRTVSDRRSRTYVDRPRFSIPLMSSNFRRFNARIGVVFVLQNRIIHLFTWKHPTATLSFLAVYSLLCLQPQLLPVVPLVALLFWIMIPSFLARHPAPANDPRVEPSYTGPPIAPPSRVKPAPEMSKDFFRNMRDLQNCMEDFSRMHDAANEYVTPYTNFSDESVSSMLFVCFFGLSCAAFVGSELVPWRAVALIAGWAATVSGHPEAQKVMLTPKTLSQMRRHFDTTQARLMAFIGDDILLNEPSEARQVEIFELQKYHAYSDTWESWLFSPSPYDPLSPTRIAGARAKGTQFFEDVQPPGGWVWKDRKWSLDLSSREWVEQRMITGVEIETEGERWVYDLPLEVVESPTKAKNTKKGMVVPKSGWEEGRGLEMRGDWRRRRWVRLVERRLAMDERKKPA